MKTDCFAFKAYKKCDRCSALSELVCKTRECSFYKTKEQYLADREKYDGIVATKLKL